MRTRFTLLLLSALGLLLTLAPVRAQRQDKAEKDQNPQQAGEVLSIDTSLVVLNVTITDAKERYVAGLKAQDFQVFEDAVPQRIASFSFEEMPFAAAILIDTSASMEPKMSLARAACARFADSIRLGDMVAIYSFGGATVKMLQDFTESRDVDPAVWETRADGETPLYDALVKAAEELAQRPERRRAIVLVSDGADTKSRATMDEAIRKVVSASVAVYAVDLSDGALSRGPAPGTGAEVLKMLAAKTGGRFFRTPGGSKLRDAFIQTVEELRNQYTITYEPTNEKRDGRWREIEVRVAPPKLNVRTRQGYHAAKNKS
jgi:Ca-activated chloride channel family protein